MLDPHLIGRGEGVKGEGESLSLSHAKIALMPMHSEVLANPEDVTKPESGTRSSTQHLLLLPPPGG